MHIDVAIDIAASPSRIWNYVSDISSHVDWMHDAIDITFVSNETEGVGTTFDVFTKVGPLHTTDRMTITEWVEDERMGVTHKGIVSGEGHFSIEPRGERTTFRWTEEISFPLQFGWKLGEIIAKPILTAIWRRNLAGLKRRIERGAGLPSDHAGVSPGALIGQGRDGDIREFGPGKVIRTSRSGSDMRQEQALMRYLHGRGYPVPQIHEHPDTSVTVMDRVDGPTMMADLAAKPWKLREHARTLAFLHEELRKIEVPTELGLASLGQGDSLLHLDIHPNNVMLTADGPVLLDWANAAIGSPDLDVALTWVIIKTGPIAANAMIKPLLESMREQFVKAFERAGGESRIRANATAAAELRLLDPNLLAAERDEVFRLARELQDRPIHSRTDDA